MTTYWGEKQSMPTKDLRIFLGPCWFGKIAPTLAAVFREKGFKATCAVESEVPARYPDAKYDVVMDFQNLKPWQIVLRRLRYFWQFLHQHDVFIFLFGNSLLPYNLDFPVLKLFRKKIIMWFIGSDIRDYKITEAIARKAGLKYYWGKDIPEEIKRKDNLKARKRMKMIRRVERYVDHIISYPNISQLLSRKYYFIFIPVDIQNIRYNNTPNPKPIIVHAPTDEAKKGTSYVTEAVEQLKKEGYEFEFHLFISNTPNNVVRETLSKADVAIDQLLYTHGGVFAVEAMAAGCAVLGGNVPEVSHRWGLPIIHTDPDNIYQNLKMLLDNPKLRQELGEKGRKYVEKYHDARKIAKDILQLLSGNTENLISYNPQDS